MDSIAHLCINIWHPSLPMELRRAAQVYLSHMTFGYLTFDHVLPRLCFELHWSLNTLSISTTQLVDVHTFAVKAGR